MVEVSEERMGEVVAAYKASGVEAVDIGRVTDDGKVGSNTVHTWTSHENADKENKIR